MKRSALACGCTLGLAAMSAAGPAHAQTETLAKVTWQTPPPTECLDPRALEQTIEARLGRRVFTSAPGTVAIDAHFLQREGAPVVRLEVRSPEGELLGERELGAESCGQLSAALPVVIAVLLDLDLPPEAPAATPPPSEPPPAPSGAPEPNAASAQPSIPATPGTPHRSLTWGVAMLGELRVTNALGPAGGGVLELSAALGALELVAWGEIVLERATAGSPRAAVRSQSLGLAFCGRTTLIAELVAGACGGAGATRLQVHGLDFEQDSPDTRWLALARAYVLLAYPLWSLLSLKLETGVTVPLQRPRYGFDQEGTRVELYRASWAFLGTFGFSVRWP